MTSLQVLPGQDLHRPRCGGQVCLWAEELEEASRDLALTSGQGWEGANSEPREGQSLGRSPPLAHA